MPCQAGIHVLKQIVAATNNPGKLAEFRAILAPLGIDVISMKEAGIHSEPEETGTTFEENARIKAQAASQAAGMPALADDSGLCVDALDGAPGIHTARFGGAISQAEKNALLLSRMTGIPKEKRTARFVSAVCLAEPSGRCTEAMGVCEGFLLTEPDGTGGFGYDPIFADLQGRSFGTLPAAEKNRISHRARALTVLADKVAAKVQASNAGITQKTNEGADRIC